VPFASRYCFDQAIQGLLAKGPETRSKRRESMAIKNPKELLVLMLSHARQGTEKSAAAYEELSDVAQHPEIKEALEARAFVSNQLVERLDQVFKLIGEKPVTVSGHLQEVFVEDFRKELSEIQSPEAKRLYTLAKIAQLNHLRMAEYTTLIAAADATGNFGAGVLLESCLADLQVFTERTRRLMSHVAAARLAARAGAS
jgi:ferritin-like metal-binding protein YciE